VQSLIERSYSYKRHILALTSVEECSQRREFKFKTCARLPITFVVQNIGPEA